jgi:hypothetical protein
MMARHPLTDPARLDQFLGNRKTTAEKRASKTIGDAAFGRAISQTREMMSTGVWGPAYPRHFVALYVVLHEMVYGVTPAELGPRPRVLAAGFAARMLEKEFDDDPGKMAAYVKWVWTREKDREEWRRKNGRDSGRIGWRLMFGPALLTDWRRSVLTRNGQ